MGLSKLAASAAFLSLVGALPQQPDFAALAAAPTLANGPDDNDAQATASLFTSFAVSGPTAAASSAAATAVKRHLEIRGQHLEARTFWPPSSSGLPFYCSWPGSFFLPQCQTGGGGSNQPPKSSTTTSSTTAKASATLSSNTSLQPSFAPTTTKSSTSSSSVVQPTTTAPPTTTQPPTTPKTCPNTPYTPYYAALSSGYVTGSATGTSSAGAPCATQPEAGTYCGFLNPDDPCAPQPDGYGPVPTPDTASAFLAYSVLHASASAAPTIVPSTDNTQYVQIFKDLNAATSAQSYLGLYTLQTYNTTECAAKCDCTDLCTAFNLFAERDPSQRPSTNDTAPTIWGNYCPNPHSQTDWKCTLWGSSIDASTATNTGETREQFQVVITASNGYDKTNITVPVNPNPPQSSQPSQSTLSTQTSQPGQSTSTSKSSGQSTQPSQPMQTSSPNPPCWQPPKNCHGKAIDAPQYWLGSRFFPGPFNPRVCNSYAASQDTANKKAGVAGVKLFNAYYLHKNGKPHGTQCSLYNSVLNPDTWATYGGGSSGKDRYDCKQSWSYAIAF